MNKSRKSGQLSLEHCQEVIEYYLNTSQRRIKYHEFDNDEYSFMKKEDNLTHKIEKIEKIELLQPNENFDKSNEPKLNITNVKSNVALFNVDYNVKTSSGKTRKIKNKKIVAKTYPASTKQYTQRELNALRLCGDAFKNTSNEHTAPYKKLIPKCFTYDSENSILFREFVEGISLTEVVHKVYNSLLDKKETTSRYNISRNLENLIKYSIETLATFHETVTTYERNILKREKRHLIKKPDPFDYAVNFANHAIELSHQIDGRRGSGITEVKKSEIDYIWQDQIINEFLKSTLGRFFDTYGGKDFGVLMGDCYPDNFLIQIDKLFPNTDKILRNSSDYHKLFSKNINPNKEGKRFRESIRMFDFGKCEMNYFQIDLNDLLNQVYGGFRVQTPDSVYNKDIGRDMDLKRFEKKHITNNIEEYAVKLYGTGEFVSRSVRNYLDSINKLRKYKEIDQRLMYKGFNQFRHNYNLCSIPELMRYAANEKIGLFKKEYVKRLDSALNIHIADLKGLKDVLGIRDLFNLDKYEEINLVRKKFA